MKVFFDTSVIVAFSDERHVHHRTSLARIVEYQAGAATDAHCLAETYATLSGKLRKPADEALFFVRDLSERFKVIEFSLSEYLDAMAWCAQLSIAGAAVYDALHARAALKAGADILYTWNVKDFLRLGPDVARLVRTP